MRGPKGKWGETSRRILSFIAKTPGASQKQIAEALGLSKGTVSYHLRRLRERGFIEMDIEGTQMSRALTLSSWKVWKVTKEGEKLITPRLRGAHNIQYRMEIWKRGTLSPIGQVPHRHWIGKKLFNGKGIYIEETTRSLIVNMTIEDSNPHRIIERSQLIIHNVKRFFESVGYMLGPPRMTSRPKFEIIGDPFAKRVAPLQAIITSHGAIDNTPEPNTLHLFDPDDADEYFKLPKTVRELRENIRTIRMEQEEILSALNELTSIFSHLKPQPHPTPGVKAEGSQRGYV